jgi:hypothetical protein
VYTMTVLEFNVPSIDWAYWGRYLGWQISIITFAWISGRLWRML